MFELVCLVEEGVKRNQPENHVGGQQAHHVQVDKVVAKFLPASNRRRTDEAIEHRLRAEIIYRK